MPTSSRDLWCPLIQLAVTLDPSIQALGVDLLAARAIIAAVFDKLGASNISLVVEAPLT